MRTLDIAFRKFTALAEFMQNYPERLSLTRFTGVDDGGLGFLNQPDKFKPATEVEIMAVRQAIIAEAKTILDNTPEKMIGKKLAVLVADRTTGDTHELACDISMDPDYTRMDFIAGQEV